MRGYGNEAGGDFISVVTTNVTVLSKKWMRVVMRV